MCFFFQYDGEHRLTLATSRLQRLPRLRACAACRHMHLCCLEVCITKRLECRIADRAQRQKGLCSECTALSAVQAPRDKLVCILNCCRVINNLLHVQVHLGTRREVWSLIQGTSKDLAGCNQQPCLLDVAHLAAVCCVEAQAFAVQPAGLTLLFVVRARMHICPLRRSPHVGAAPAMQV